MSNCHGIRDITFSLFGNRLPLNLICGSTNQRYWKGLSVIKMCPEETSKYTRRIGFCKWALGFSFATNIFFYN
jgi:hypothetical protein